MEIELIQIIIPAAAGLVVGFCIGLFAASRKSVPVKVVQDLLLLIMNFVRALSDGKLTQDEKETLIQNIGTLIKDVREQISGGGTSAAAALKED